MFNLFKSHDVVVQQIHDEIDQAQDNLLEQAKKIIAECSSDSESSLLNKGARLEALGFTNTEVVLRSKQQIQNLVISKEQADVIEYYKQNYPFQKFITETELNRICEKYELIHASVSCYLKDVPEKNLIEIEIAPPLSIQDIRMDRFILSANRDSTQQDLQKLCSALGHSDCAFTQQEIIDILIKYRGHDVPNWTISAQNNTWLYCIREHLQIGSYMYDKVEKSDYSGLFIAAPKSHFNLQGQTKKGKYGFLKVNITKVEDPIVFRYCRGGIQILSKWGLEANDSLVVNEKHN